MTNEHERDRIRLEDGLGRLFARTDERDSYVGDAGSIEREHQRCVELRAGGQRHAGFHRPGLPRLKLLGLDGEPDAVDRFGGAIRHARAVWEQEPSRRRPGRGAVIADHDHRRARDPPRCPLELDRPSAGLAVDDAEPLRCSETACGGERARRRNGEPDGYGGTAKPTHAIKLSVFRPQRQGHPTDKDPLRSGVGAGRAIPWREALTGSAHHVKRHDMRGPRLSGGPDEHRQTRHRHPRRRMPMIRAEGLLLHRARRRGRDAARPLRRQPPARHVLSPGALRCSPLRTAGAAQRMVLGRSDCATSPQSASVRTDARSA